MYTHIYSDNSPYIYIYIFIYIFIYYTIHVLHKLLHSKTHTKNDPNLFQSSTSGLEHYSFGHLVSLGFAADVCLLSPREIHCWNLQGIPSGNLT